MLNRLKVTNFLLIEDLDLELSSGLTVVTGETGSGKSIIIDALMLLFGSRITKEFVRNSAYPTIFTAEFTLKNQDAIDWLINNDLQDVDDQQNLVCRRVVDASKHKIYINGHRVTNSQIKTLGELLLDIHTQHTSITLLKTDVQRVLLDKYAENTPLNEQLANLYNKIADTKSQLEQSKQHTQELEERKQALTLIINELESLELAADEWHKLEIEHKLLLNAKTILQDLDFALEVLENGDTTTNIKRLSSRLQKTAQNLPELAPSLTLLDSITIEIDELINSINLMANKIDQDPEHLTIIEQRMEQIFSLSRKYRILPQEIPEKLFQYQQEVLKIEQITNIQELNAQLEQLEQDFIVIATKVSAARKEASHKLDLAMNQLLESLALIGTFKTELIPQDPYTRYGLEHPEFRISFNKGMSLQPLAKAASGGELSRTALALYLLLSSQNQPEVIIFDEIDVGIGGRIASIVGSLLNKLGVHKQVICITHQPQTAVYGNNHLVVSKEHHTEISKAQINHLTDKERVLEIARMLSGNKITNATLEHAADLLKSTNI